MVAMTRMEYLEEEDRLHNYWSVTFYIRFNKNNISILYLDLEENIMCLKNGQSHQFMFFAPLSRTPKI